jgi:hypothetical protein
MKENNNKLLKVFKKLIKFDTPTICNALELINPIFQKKRLYKRKFYLFK